MTRTITPKAVDDGEGFEMNGTKGKQGFAECKCGMDDEVEGYYRDSRLVMEPLEVVFGPYLNGSGFCEGEVGSGVVEGAMIKLPMREVRLESSKLSI